VATFGGETTATAFLHLRGEGLHRGLSDFSTFAAGQGCIGLVKHGQDFEASTLALFPEGQRFLDGLFFALEPPALDGLPHESPLIRRQLDVHSSIVARRNHAQRPRGSRDLNQSFTSFERHDNRAEIRFDAAQQFGLAYVSKSNLHDLRTAAKNLEHSKILVLGNDNGARGLGVTPDVAVLRAGKADVEHMLGYVPARLNPPRQRRGQLCVDEESQLRVPKYGVIVLAGGEFQHRRDVFVFEVRVVGQNLFPRRPGSEQIQHVFHADAEPANAGAATANVRIHRDSVDRAHILRALLPDVILPFLASADVATVIAPATAHDSVNIRRT
jgi:hypothetical protein